MSPEINIFFVVTCLPVQSRCSNWWHLLQLL